MANPMARIITGSRDSLLYGAAPAAGDLAYVAAASLLVLLAGYLVFDHYEPRFAEEI